MKTDVCVICHSYYPWDPRVRREAECLVEHGYSVEIFCLRDDGQRLIESVDGVTVYRLPIKRHRGSNLFVYVVEYIAFFLMCTFIIACRYFTKRYKLIHVHNLPDFLVFATVIPKLFGAKVLLDIHDVMPEFFVSKYNIAKDHFIVRFIGWVETMSTRFANRVLVAAPSFKEAIASRGTPKGKMEVLMNVAYEKLFDVSLYKNAYNNAQQKLKLIYHGSLNEHYDFQTMLGAMAILRTDIDNFELNIFGTGPMLGKIERLISQLCLDECVYLKGAVPQEQIPEIILSHDLGIVPMSQKSFTDIAFPTRLFEYVAMERPVIASRRKSIESCFDDSCVLFFEPSNVEQLAGCIEKLYLDPGKAKSLVSNATRVYQKYRWKLAKISYINLVEELCS